jgi:hypothetical protein
MTRESTGLAELEMVEEQDSEKQEHEALDRLLRYAKREAERQAQMEAAELIAAAITALSDHFDRSPVH